MTDTPKQTKPTPEDLGYPPNYNPYQQQKKRYKRLKKQLSDAQNNISLIGATFHQFGEDEKSQHMMVFLKALEEIDETLSEWWKKEMLKFN